MKDVTELNRYEFSCRITAKLLAQHFHAKFSLAIDEFASMNCEVVRGSKHQYPIEAESMQPSLEVQLNIFER